MNANIANACLVAALLSSSPLLHAATLDLQAADLNVPDLGSSASKSLTSTEESLLGVETVRKLRGSEPVVEDPELSSWLQNLGNRLARHAPNNGKFHFLIVKNPDINAYAMPGGIIAIHSGLILNTQSESELAAVIAHEIAHVSQRHIARMMSDQELNPLVTGLGVVAGAAAARNSPEAAKAIITGTMAAQAHQQLSFSRQMETEADRVGLRILTGAGFDPQAMPAFMEKLDRRTHDLYGDISRYLRTHPLSIDRLSDTRNLASQMGKRAARENETYVYAREKLRAMTAPASPVNAQGDPQLTHYAQALRQLQSNPQAALQTLGNPAGNLPVTLAIAQAYNQSHRYADTEKLLTPLANGSQREAVLPVLAEALLANGKAAQAWSLLDRVQLVEQTSLEFLEIRQRVAEQAGQSAEAYRSAAERSTRMGEYKHARALLEQATRIPGVPAQTAARMHAMMLDIDRAENRSKLLDKR